MEGNGTAPSLESLVSSTDNYSLGALILLALHAIAYWAMKIRKRLRSNEAKIEALRAKMERT